MCMRHVIRYRMSALRYRMLTYDIVYRHTIVGYQESRCPGRRREPPARQRRTRAPQKINLKLKLAAMAQWILTSDDSSTAGYHCLHLAPSLPVSVTSLSGNPTPVPSRGCFGISHRYPRAGSYLSRYHGYPILIFASHLTRKVIHEISLFPKHILG